MDFLRNAPQPTASNLEHFVVRLMLRPDDIAEIEALIAARRLEQGAEPALAAAAANAVAGVVEESCAPPTGNATTSATCATTTTGAPVSADLVCNGYSTAVHAAASQVAAACSSEVRPDATPPARLRRGRRAAAGPARDARGAPRTGVPGARRRARVHVGLPSVRHAAGRCARLV